MKTDGERPRSAAHAIATYIRAKDCNRPHLMEAAFAREATLEMIVKVEGMSFPPEARGIDELTHVLVSRFNQAFENIYTLCLAAPPDTLLPSFSCDWLVGMSEKGSREIRVGCGRYDWSFRPPGLVLVEKLRITIEGMQSLPPHAGPSVMAWLSKLPHPWCSAQAAVESMPRFEALRAVTEHIARVHEEAGAP